MPEKQYEGLLLASLRCVHERSVASASLRVPALLGKMDGSSGTIAESTAATAQGDLNGAEVSGLSGPDDASAADAQPDRADRRVVAGMTASESLSAVMSETQTGDSAVQLTDVDGPFAARAGSAGADALHARHCTTAVLDAPDALPSMERSKVDWQRFAAAAQGDVTVFQGLDMPEGTRMLGRRVSDVAALNAAFEAHHTVPQLALVRPNSVPQRTWARLSESQRHWYSHTDQVLEHTRAHFVLLLLSAAAAATPSSE